MKIFSQLKINLAFIKANVSRFSFSQFISIYWYKFILKKELSQKLKLIREKYYFGNALNQIDASKYLNLDTWVLENLGRIYSLGLNKESGLRTLDISTGCGYLPFIARYFGNDAEATDLPDCEVYNETISALGIKRQICEITSFKKLTIEGRYDLITAYMICFNKHALPDVWHINEWEYFLKNLREHHLTQDGEIFLSFNPEKVEEPVNPTLLEYFSSKKAFVTADSVFFNKSSLKNI